MNLRTKTLSGVLLTGLALAPFAIHASSLSAQAAPVPEQRATPSACFNTHATTATPDVTANGVRVHLQVEVASTTRIDLDKHGNVKAIGTNTGCAPKSTDDFIIERDDKYTPASAGQIDAALACKTTGAWHDTTVMHDCK